MSAECSKSYIEAGESVPLPARSTGPDGAAAARTRPRRCRRCSTTGHAMPTCSAGRAAPFKAPARLSDLKVVERLKGSTTTDFGAPEAHPRRRQAQDGCRRTQAQRDAAQGLLAAFDAAAKAARGKTLRTGPRGGGREPGEDDRARGGRGRSLLARLGWWTLRDEKQTETDRGTGAQGGTRRDSGGAAGEIHAEGPRGGKRWSPRYFVRRAAWHVLDHAWEIEDRLE